VLEIAPDLVKWYDEHQEHQEHQEQRVQAHKREQEQEQREVETQARVTLWARGRPANGQQAGPKEVCREPPDPSPEMPLPSIRRSNSIPGCHFS
jgi:hypothetical protein